MPFGKYGKYLDKYYELNEEKTLHRSVIILNDQIHEISYSIYPESGIFKPNLIEKIKIKTIHFLYKLIAD